MPFFTLRKRPHPGPSVLFIGALVVGVSAFASMANAGDGDSNALYVTTTDTDPFYAQPEPMPPDPPGTLLDSRPVPFIPAPGVEAPQYPAWQLRFVSTDADGNRVAAMAMVVEPAIPQTEKRLFLLNEPYNSLGATCTPSRFYSGQGSHPNHGTAAGWGNVMVNLLDAGWTTISTDWGGHLYTTGSPIEGGYVLLDTIRAAGSFAPLGLSVDAPVALHGFSGGSRPVVWAAMLQPSYAPELNLVGISSGGTIVDSEFTHTTSTTAVQFSGAMGLARAYPRFFPAEILNARGVEAAISLRDGCFGDTSDGSPKPDGVLEDYVVAADPLGRPEATEVYEQVSLLQAGQPDLVPGTAAYVFQGAEDARTPANLTDELVQKWCDAGVAVFYNRVPGLDHVTSALAHWDGIRWLHSRATGIPFVPTATTKVCNGRQELPTSPRTAHDGGAEALPTTSGCE